MPALTAIADSADASARPAVLLGLLFACLWVLGFALCTWDLFMDDAFIGFRYVANLLSGQGLVFNPGERVEGITNIGWLLALAPFAGWLTPPIAAKVLGTLLLIITLFLLVAILRRAWPGPDAALVVIPACLLTATQFDFVYYSLAGMETALLAAVLCLIAWLAHHGRGRLAIPLLCAFAFLVHPECLLIYPLLFALQARREGLCSRAASAVVFAAAIAAITLARVAYFGDPLPNTFYAKTTPLAALPGYLYEALAGAKANISIPLRGPFVLLFVAFGALCLWRRNACGAAALCVPCLVGFAFAAYARPDWTCTGRYFAPFVPFAFALAWIGVVESHRRLLDGILRPAHVTRLLAAYAIVLLTIGLTYTGRHLQTDYVSKYPGYVLMARTLVAPSKWMRDNLKPGAVIASSRIGALSYYSEHPVLDYKFGLTDRRVGRLTREVGWTLDTPAHPLLRDLWREVRPEYLLEDEPLITDFARAAGGTTRDFAIHGVHYRLMHTFRIAPDVNWALCERVP